MNFGRFDITIILVMTIAIISMSFVFPALGLTGTEANENNIPEFNDTADRYEFNEEFPREPGTPSQGKLVWIERDPGLSGSQSVWLDGDTSSGQELTIVNTGNLSDPDIQITIHEWVNGAVNQTEFVTITEEGQSKTLDGFGYETTQTWEDTKNNNTSDLEITAKFVVNQQPSDTTWFGRIPVVGGIVGAGDHLAGIVGWIGSIMYWLTGTITSLIIQMFVILLDIMSYTFNMVFWVLDLYWSLVDGASAWASVFVMIPGILLFLEWAKLAFIGVDLIWLG